jgi:hypothetical protein
LPNVSPARYTLVRSITRATYTLFHRPQTASVAEANIYKPGYLHLWLETGARPPATVTAKRSTRQNRTHVRDWSEAACSLASLLFPSSPIEVSRKPRGKPTSKSVQIHEHVQPPIVDGSLAIQVRVVHRELT